MSDDSDVPIEFVSDPSSPSLQSFNGVIQIGHGEVVYLLIGNHAMQSTVPLLSISQLAPTLTPYIDYSDINWPVLRLPDEDVYIWCWIGYWLDKQCLPPLLDSIISHSRGATDNLFDDPDLLVNIYAAACRFQIPALQREIMLALEYVHLGRPDPMLPSAASMSNAYEVTRGRCNQGIRLMFRDWCVVFVRLGLAPSDFVMGLSDEAAQDMYFMMDEIHIIHSAERYFVVGSWLEREGCLTQTGTLMKPATF